MTAPRRRVAVVTGAASGLGLGLVRELVARGARVVMADVDAPALADAVEQLTHEGAEVSGRATDVTKCDQVEALAAFTMERYGSPSLVCSNAGVSVLGRAWELAVEDWRWVYAVNVWGAVNMIRSFVPTLIARDEGRVMITVSNTAVTARARYGAYASSKHAVLSICESLDLDLRECGSAVRVAAVLPGPIRSGMARVEDHRPPEFGPPKTAGDDVQAVHQYLSEHGADPQTLAGAILDAADAGRFYIFTHPQNLGLVNERAEDMRNGSLAHRIQAPI